MPTVKIRFPGGRYHATPWGHHVNEGLIEWPPSPWRLLRAFVACGFSKLGWTDRQLIPGVAQSLLQKLSNVLPSYSLPAASAAHSRHFMPVGTIEKGREKTTLVFDTWANVGDGPMLIHWPCDLDSSEMELLANIVDSQGYLGRSESWVEANLIDDVAADWNAKPCLPGEHVGLGYEQISLMAPIPPADYANWRMTQVAEVRRPFQHQKMTAALRKKIEQAEKPYPPDLLACMMIETADWKAAGWSHPPGSQRVLYWRRNDALQVGVPVAPRRPEPRSIECVLLALTSPSGNRSALPHISRGLPQAEFIRRALICRAADGERIDCPSLLGKSNGERIRGSHDHAYFIPLDTDCDQHIDHFLIYAPGKLCSIAQRAIRRLKRTWTKGGVGDLQLACVGFGDLSSLRAIERVGTKIELILGSTEGSHVWESMTPFVLPRYRKTQGKDTFEGQIQAELAVRGFPAAAEIQLDKDLSVQMRNYVRSRSRGGVPPKIDAGFGVRLRFSQPIQGPILLGYASHYGLGLFRACSE